MKKITTRTKALLLSESRLADSGEHLGGDLLAETEPLLAAVSAASITSRITIGPRAGHPLERIGAQMEVDTITFDPTKPRCASAGGLNLHANVAVPAHDRERLDRLARYLLRPPFAGERLRILEGGRVLYELKHPSQPDSMTKAPTPKPRRLSWTEPLRRTFATEILICPTCGGSRRVLEVVTDPGLAHRILQSRRPP